MNIESGMILAAGLGTRLRPITEQTPKPLVPVLNIPNVLFNVYLMKQSGIRDITFNLFHLADQMEEYLGDGSKWGLNFKFSREDILLGTGGGVKKASHLFPDRPFVLANCDFITNFPIKEAVDFHQKKSSLGTMVLFEDAMMQSFYSKVGVDEQGHLCSLPSLEIKVPSKTGIFSGIHVLEGETMAHLEEKPSGINQILYPAIMKEAPERLFGAFMGDHYWYDTGNLYFLWMTSMRLMERMKEGDEWIRQLLEEFGGLEEKEPHIWAPKGEDLPSACMMTGPLILGKGCNVGKNCQLGPYTVIGDRSTIRSGNRLGRFVALPGAQTTQKQVAESGLLFGNKIVDTKKLG